MKKNNLYFCALAMLNLLLFLGVFKLMQHEKVYHHSLGLISENYERIGGWNDYEIKKVAKPFIELKNTNFLNWDAAIYSCIHERMYQPEDDCYGRVRSAFLPLFPLVWRFTGASPIGISLINYLLFVVSIGVLLVYLSHAPPFQKLVLFTIFISLPAVISFYIPYSEALFMLSMSLAAVGLLKKNYALFFVGCLLMATTRLASAFVLLAILIAEGAVLLDRRDVRHFIKQIFEKGLPFAIGYLVSLIIQYQTTGSWSAMLEARKHWGGFTPLSEGFKDWSIEGFGLSVFGVVFVVIPALGFLVYTLSRWTNNSFVSKLKNYRSAYLFLVSVLYLIGVLAFTLITQGADLHSNSRYVLASPFFFIGGIVLLNYVIKVQYGRLLWLFALLTGLLTAFLYFVEYGGDRLQFSFAGTYLLVITGFFLVFHNRWKRFWQGAVALLLILLNTVWNTYLLNSFLNNAWVFT